MAAGNSRYSYSLYPYYCECQWQGERNTTQAQAQTVPDYPPMYDVDVRVCGNIIAPLKDGKRCVNQQLRLWGPVGEAKLARAGISLPSVKSVEHKLAITSKGCYPVYSQPDQQQFYWADSIKLIGIQAA